MNFVRRKSKLAFIAITTLLVCLLSLVSFAQGNAVITIADATGHVGDTVEIDVSMTNAKGMETGEFSISFDDSILKITSVSRGALTQAADFYMDTFGGGGVETSPLNAQWYWNTGSCQIDDGVLITISFELLSEGTSDLMLSLDPDAFLNVTLADSHNNGSVTVESYQLAKVEKPTWDGHTINWIGVANASSYTVNLYKDSVWTWNGIVNASARSLNLGNYMSTYGPGGYTATVKALAATPYINGPESEHSDVKVYSVTLGQVGQPSWGTGWTITWNDLADGSPDYGDHVLYYNVNLEKEGSSSTLITVGVNPSLKQYTFDSGDFDGPGSYYVTVQAIGDNNLYFSGPLSDASAVQVRQEQLGQVDQPTWDDTEPGVIKWLSVAHAESYKIELLKSGAVVETEYTTGLSCDFLAAMRGAEGSYTVRVTALAAAGSNYEDGPASPASAAKVVAKLAAPTKPGFSDEGVASWDAVTGANGYTVSLYKGGVLVEEQTTLPAAERKYDFLSAIRESGPGSYTVRVKAMGTGYDLNSDESAASDSRVAAALAAPTGLVWKSNTEPELSWSAVTGATGYKVQLYKGGTAMGDPYDATGTSYDFATVIGDTAGYYTAKVQAVGDSYFALDSPFSALSATFTKTGPLGTVTELALSDKGVATWVDEPDAFSFSVQLNKVGFGAVDSALSVDPGMESADFRDAMRGAGVGDYYVSVTAIAEEGSLFSDGNVFNSNDQTVSKLAAPGAIFISKQGVFTWLAVDNATNYTVTLNLPSGHPESVDPPSEVDVGDALSIDCLSYMRQHPGKYSVTITARDTVGLYLDSDGASASQTVKKLDQVAKPVLNNSGVATWVDVNDAVSYVVALYKDAALIAEETVAPGVGSFNFLAAIEEEGEGSYTVTVRALGDGYMLLDGDASDASEAVTLKALPKVNKPVLSVDNDNDEVTLAWDAVEDATLYLVTLYNGSGYPVIEEITDGTSMTGPAPDDAGFYWATVQAIGSGVILDGPESERSVILVVFEWGFAPVELEDPVKGRVASGWLPVPGYLWMQITSETGANGVMVIESSASGAPNAPEGLTAAGVFYDIELDEYLAGSHVLIKAGYDHVKLPQGMDETTLRLYRYDAEEGWMLLDSEVDTSEKVVLAEVDKFSTVAIFGAVIASPVEPGDELEEKKPEGELPRTFGYISLLLLASLILVAAGLLFFRRRQGIEGR